MFGTGNKDTFSIITITTMCIVISTLHSNGYNKKEDRRINILIWTPTTMEPFNFVDMGVKAFENCKFKNCFLTANRSYLNNVQDFDVIMFNVWHVGEGYLNEYMPLPSNRSAAQKYCMYGMEPAGYHPVSAEWNGFFNFTFTYKLTSNVTIPYVVVKNANDEIIGPKVNMQWMKLSEMNETSYYIKNKLQNKNIAVAWIVSHCETPWRRMYADNLSNELTRYGHSLHVYGKCGIQCPKNERMDECFALIESDYFFYLSFENSFGEDYVTEKLLNALEHFSVPVVFGRADYSRFMPDGIYLDANVLTPDKMAEKMNEIIYENSKYYEFFKWHDHYSFHFTGEDRYSREICRLCDFLNNNLKVTSILDNIADWWNEEFPQWPVLEKQTKVETFISNLLNFLEPSSD